MRSYEIECVIALLERAERHAIDAGIDHHFISELRHLIATAKANKDQDE